MATLDPSLTPGTQANAQLALREYSELARQIWSLLQSLSDMKQREATHGYSAIFQNTATYSLNPDGTPGSSDATPNTSHPMVGTYHSANDYQGFSGYVVNDLYNFLIGVSGPTVADRRPAIQGMLR